MKQKSRVLLMVNFPSVFSYLIIHAKDQSHLKKCLAFLETKTAKDLSELLPTNRGKVMVELLTMYNFSKSRIVQALGMCALADNNFKHVEKKKGTKSLPQHVVANYVSNGLMAVLSSFTTSFSNKETHCDTKVQIIKSMTDLILFLKHENIVSSKNALLECIRVANIISPQLGLQDEVLDLWMSFVKTLEPSAIRGILPQILCCLLLHLATHQGKTLDIFKFLLQENIEHFR